MRREGENDIHLDGVGAEVGSVTITAEDDAFVVSIDGHTQYRFALGDYSHVCSPIRPWIAVNDVAHFLRELAAR